MITPMYVPELRMVILRPIGHIAAWLVWHSTGKSLLSDLDAGSSLKPGACRE